MTWRQPRRNILMSVWKSERIPPPVTNQKALSQALYFGH